MAERESSKVEIIDHQWIPLSDGTRLSARIWLPEGARQNPAPAILEYLPYRKDDLCAERDHRMHSGFARHGYAGVRVDIRGTGDSEGVLRGEYVPQEQDDAVEVIAWLAAQPWCSGRVGMMGISWGGFNSLQVAARRPPGLAAIISVCSTDDRYSDDVHYIGGCINAWDAVLWSNSLTLFSALPPDPAVVGDDWRAMWLSRLEAAIPHQEEWLRHQRRDEYWKQGSVCEDFSAPQVPIYMIGGWGDGYRSAVFRVLAGYRGPRKGLIGPWAHSYPDTALPGPQIDFVAECVRWWDRWLRDVPNGIDAEPMLTVWLQESQEVKETATQRTGRWVDEDSWPSKAVETTFWRLSPDGLWPAETSLAEESLRPIAGSLLNGLDAGAWCPFGAPDDFAPDQRREDGLSLCLDTEPLREPLEVLGTPYIELVLETDKPLGMVAVRLCDVSPAGESLLVTRGLLNLAHRDSHETPSPLALGERLRVRLPLMSCGHRFAPGRRIRVAISPNYWPWAWPSPEIVTLRVLAGEGSTLELPTRVAAAPRPGSERLPEPASAPEIVGPEFLPLPVVGPSVVTCQEMGSGRVTVNRRLWDRAQIIAASGLRYHFEGHDEYHLTEGDPLSARLLSEATFRAERGGWQPRVSVTTAMTSTGDAYQVTASIDAFEGDSRVFSRRFEGEVARDLT